MPLKRTPLRPAVDALLDRVHQAARESVNEVVEAARDDAAVSHPWVNRNGQLEEEIVSKHADTDESPTATFGTTERRGFYGLFHELGTREEFERPFLRPAADRQFPRLAGVIEEKLR